MDGDTFDARIGGKILRVRVAGYDAPELGQPFSHRAKQKIHELTSRGAECHCYKQDRYGRSICTVRTTSGDNVADLMLSAGLGCIDPRFEFEASATDRQNARAALAQAQHEGRGIWGERMPVCGYVYRQASTG